MNIFRLCSGARSPTWSRVLAVVAMSLFLTLSATVCAYAEEGFLGGLQTLVEPDLAQEVESDPVRDYEYEPVLREVEEQPELEEGTTISTIDGVVQSASRVQWGNNATKYTPLAFLQTYFNYVGRQNSQFLLFAVGMVFMWWGVRKAIKVVMAAWRGGKASI